MCTQGKRIQGGGTPIGDTHQQKNEGDQRVKKTGHHVTDCSAEHTGVNTHSSATGEVTQTSWWSRRLFQPTGGSTDSPAGLLDESNGDQDSLPQEDEREENERLCYRDDYH